MIADIVLAVAFGVVSLIVFHVLADVVDMIWPVR